MNEDCQFYEQPSRLAVEHTISGQGIPLSHLLRHSKLTVEQKIRLSHSVARAFWQFYNSSMTESRWTSEEIFFVPLADPDTSQEIVPLRPFVSFPLGNQYKQSPAELCSDKDCLHKYPRILHLGIVLLEIGLGQPLELSYDTELSFLAHTNLARGKAYAKLKDLKKNGVG